MSNIIVGGWSALKEDLHHATEFASNCAGPDGAKERVKLALTKVLEKFEALALEEAKALVPVVEEIVVDEIAHVANAGTDPVVEAPVVEAPVVEAPVVEAPVVEAPVVEAPVVEAHVVEAPVVEAPVVEAPVVEAPVVEAPVVEAPVVEAPVVEAPVVEAEAPAGEPAETETK